MYQLERANQKQIVGSTVQNYKKYQTILRDGGYSYILEKEGIGIVTVSHLSRKIIVKKNLITSYQ